MADTRTPPVALVFDLPRVATPGPVPMVFGDSSAPPPAPVLPGVHLVFDQPRITTPGPVSLVFGDTGDTPAPGIPDATLASTAQLSGLRARVAVRVGALLAGGGQVSGLRARVVLRAGAVLAGGGQVSGLRIAIAARYDTDTQRPTVGQAASTWVYASAQPSAVGFAHQGATPAPTGWAAHWQDAQDASTPVRHPLPSVLVPAVQHLQAPHQNATPVHDATGFAHQQAAPVLLAQVGKFEGARPVHDATGFSHQDGAKTHGCFAARFQGAIPRRIFRRALQQKGLSWLLHRAGRYQEAVPPPPGKSRPPEKPKPDPCYVPELPAALVFDTLPYTPSLPAHLVFVCERHPGPGPERPHYVIPRLTLYMTTHSISAHLLPGMEPVTLLDATIDTDDGSWCWGLQASGPEHLLDQLAPGAGGLPARVQVTIDGIDWVFAIERLSRTRRFGQHRCAVQGRSVTALLSEDYLPQQSWHNAGAQLTAQQAVAQALDFTGTTLDWGVTDWLLPAGAWSHTGAPLSAALRVAESIGAVVRSHRTLQELQIAPRYAIEPWDWASATPDVTMPADVIVTDSLEPDTTPAYNALHLSGQAGGIRAHAARKGTAGDLLAPQVTDALLTDAVAARQRATAILGAAGIKQRHSMDVPLLTGGSNPGLLLPGYLLHVDDLGGKSWRGLVRGISVRASLPTVRQSISIERRGLT